MSYPPVRWTQPAGEVSGTFRAADADRELADPGGGGAAYLAPAALTGGDYGLFRYMV